MFKRMATKLAGLIKDKAAETAIQVNPGWDNKPRIRPRKGTFEVRIKTAEGAITIVSLKGMPRPFKKLRALDLEEVANNVVGALE